MLFFKTRKGKTGNSQDSAVATRAPRYGSLAAVSINGFEGMAILRNVSQSGFRMESKTFVEMEPENVYIMLITPEISSGVKQFEIKVEVRWIQSTEDKFSAGLMAVEDGNRPFQRYVDFLKSASRVV
jgi:hypothetical protein